MRRPISVAFSDSYVSKMEEDIFVPMKPHFYKKYTDGTYIQRKKNELDSLFVKLNSYHPNVKLTIESNPAKFLDTEITERGCEIETKVSNRFKKLPVRWSLKTPTRYKRNDITVEFHDVKA